MTKNRVMTGACRTDVIYLTFSKKRPNNVECTDQISPIFGIFLGINQHKSGEGGIPMKRLLLMNVESGDQVKDNESPRQCLPINLLHMKGAAS